MAENNAKLQEAPALRASILLLTGGKLLSLAITLLTVAIMTRYLGTDGYGDYRLIIAFLVFATGLANLGTPLIIARELAQPGANQARVLGNALGLRLVAVLIAVLFAGAVAWALSPSPGVVLGILVGAIGFVAAGQHAVLFILYQQRLRQAGAVLADVSGVVLLALLVWVLTKTGVGVIAFVVATAASSLLTLTISSVFARMLLRFRPRFELLEWRRLLVSSAPIAVTSGLTLVYYRLDTIVLGMVHPGEAVGLYGVASKILDAIVGLTLLFSGLLMPLMSRHAADDLAKFRHFFDLGVDTLAIGTGAILLVILLHAEQIVGLVGGADFAPGGSAFRVLGVVAMIASLRYMAHQAVTALHAQAQLLSGFFAAAVIGVIAYVSLIPIYGALGAALGLLLGELVVFGWTIRVLHHSGATLKTNVPIKVLISIGLTILAWQLLEKIALPWVFSASLAASLYILLLWLTRGIPRHVLELLKIARLS